MKKYFVTGTDTEVGKTFVSCVLMKELKLRQYQVAGLKPIASGASEVEGRLRNSDALALINESTVAKDETYEIFNPNIFREAIAPHIAARREGRFIDLEKINQSIDTMSSYHPDYLLIEGAGGWKLPISQTEFLSQWVQDCQLPVILVVGVRLGCLNHAMLTIESIRRANLKIAGWVANHVDSGMPYKDENIATLQNFIHAPLLGELPTVTNLESALGYLDITPLIVS